MRRVRHFPGRLACLALLVSAAWVRAESPPDPLRLVPNQADVVFKVEAPRRLANTIYALELFKQFRQLDSVRETYESTNYRRFFQLVAYFEKQLGMKWPDMLDQLAGGGAAVSTRIGADPAPLLLVVQGKDAKLANRFFALAMDVADQELARQESKDRLTRSTYRNVATVHFGKQFLAAVIGSTLLASNNSQALEKAINLHLDGPSQSMAQLPGIAEARKVLPPRPLAWAWLNLVPIKKLPQAQAFFDEKQNDGLLTVAAGSLLDLARRSPFVCAGIYHQDNSLLATIRLPRGVEGMPAKFAMSHPPADQPGSLPLLKPKNLLATSSAYFDAAQFWLKRKELFNEKQVKTFEKFNKTSGRFLAGARFSDLITQAGPYQRFVVVQPTHSGYKTRPNTIYPAGAVIVSMREPDKLGKSLDTLLRATALLAGGQFNLKLVEQQKGAATIVGYRFPENPAPSDRRRNDANNIRFNFSPCFVRVGNQFVVSSTMELADELVDLLDKEAKATNRKGSPATTRTELYATGGATILRVFKDRLVTQAILGRAVSPEEAQQQVQALIDLVNRLGVVKVQQEYNKNSFHYDIRWQWSK